MEMLIIRYGVVAILLGAGIEGEPFALAGGVLVHSGWMPWWEATGAAILGSCLVDQLWFHLARHFRSSRPVTRIARRPAFARTIILLEQHPAWFVLLFRFAYGLRAVAPVAIGMSRISKRLFVPLNFTAAVVWGSLFTAFGFALGPVAERLAQRFGTELAVGVAAVSLGVLAFALRRE
jgi:membrane protein DedA with SNARE-associated domain